jgi:hypothetical protein
MGQSGSRRARLLPRPPGGVFGSGCSGVSFGSASNFASAARSGSRRGARGNRSSSMARRIAAVTAAYSSSVRSIVGMAYRLLSLCHRKSSIQRCTAALSPSFAYIIPIITSPLSAGLSVSGCVLRSDAMLATACVSRPRQRIRALVFCTKRDARPVSMRSLVFPTQAYADSGLK